MIRRYHRFAAQLVDLLLKFRDRIDLKDRHHLLHRVICTFLEDVNHSLTVTHDAEVVDTGECAAFHFIVGV